ncbi:MAG: hypothetical protein HQM03_14985 [Magnetococcales bacterium]|nr:hypothetical protein [Magnetococcales bacterium]
MTDTRIKVTVGHQPIRVTVRDEILNFSSPLVLQSTGGWPFGENPRRVSGIARSIPTVVDQVAMPGQFRLVKWLLAITDDTNGLGVGSEINAFIKGGEIAFTEYAITGDAETIGYEIAFVVAGDEVRMVFTSFYDGLLEVNTMKIGVLA